jgi:ATP-dependent Clp protease ATP-binding subunit ClpC
MKKVPTEIYYNEPLFKLTQPERIAAEILVSIWSVLFTVTTVILLLSTWPLLRWIGALMFLFVIDGAVHLWSGNESLGNIARKRKANLDDFFTPAAKRVLISAYGRAATFGGDPLLYVGLDLVLNPGVREALLRMDVEPKEIEAKFKEKVSKSLTEKKLAKNEITQKLTELAGASSNQALSSARLFIEPADVFAGLRDLRGESTDSIFDLFEIESGDLERALIFGRFRRTFPRRLPSALGGFRSEPFGIRHRYMNRAWTARPTPVLDRFSVDLTDLARAGRAGFLINHEDEYDRLLDTISRPNRPNAILVGEPGVEKETIVGHLASMISQDEVPAPLFDKRLVSLDMSALMSNADQAELEARVKSVFSEIYAAGNIILFVPDIHNLTKTAGGKGLSASDILIPYLTSNDFPTIATTYPKEYKQFIEPNNSFADAFQVISVRELDQDEAERVLVYDSLLLEQSYRIKISYAAIKAAVQVAHRYFGDKKLPSSADDLLKEALADASHRQSKILRAEDVIAIAERRIHIPIHRPGQEEAQTLLNLEQTIHERLIDQEQAVTAVARALREYRSGLSRKGGPIATFLFVGPTGVGKTELAKILASVQFGSEDSMVRFDMSEYQDKQSIYRFIGSPDGSVSGELTDRIIERPYSLVLLDEFEKANSEILNLFLQVFDDGRLTDNMGRVADFQNTIIIATSNAHSDIINSSLNAGESMEEIADYLKRKLTDIFRPELLNRFSGIIIFKSLSPNDLKSIAKLQVKELAASLKDSQDIELECDDQALALLVELGYDPAFGARPLRGVISDKLKSVLAEKILSGEIEKGGKLTIGADGKNFAFLPEK